MLTSKLYHTVMNHTHGPVQTTKIHIGDKQREISIYTEADQAIHRKIKEALWKDYATKLSPRCYAYVRGRSCLDAVVDANKQIKKYEAFVRTDIKSFFPSISKDILGAMLCQKYPEDFVKKMLSFVTGRAGGLSQGSALSPLLSNIYLSKFDQKMSKAFCYYRYSDDIVILCAAKETNDALKLLDDEFSTLKLQRNTEKTALGYTTREFQFLGFSISKKGVHAALNKKAELDDKIQGICAEGRATVKERMDRMKQAIVGWQNYYREQYPIPQTWYGIFYKATYGAKKEFFEFCQQCGKITLTHEQFEYLTKIVLTKFGPESVIQAFFLISGMSRDEIIDMLIVKGKYDLAQKIAGSELVQDQQQSDIQNQLGEQTKRTKQAEQTERPEQSKQVAEDDEPIQPEKEDAIIEIFGDIFISNFEKFYISPVLGSKEYEPFETVPSDEWVEKHINGEYNLAVGLDIQGNARALIFDIDIDKTQINDANMEKAREIAKKTRERLSLKGLDSFASYSGSKGFHVWVIFEKMQTLPTLNELGQSILREVELEGQHINVEIFPNLLTIGQRDQNIVKLPFGKHPVTFQYCYALDEQMQEMQNLEKALKSIQINAWQSETKTVQVQSEDLLSKLSKKFPNAHAVYANCWLVRHVVNKGLKNSFLGHYERLLLSYVFPPMGEEGALFMHHVMKGFYNYSYSKTEGFIKKAPPFAVSCPKIRKYLELELGEGLQCECHFNCKNMKYPTPILHAVHLEVSLDKYETEVYRTVQQLMNAAKEKKELDKQIQNYERQLDDFFSEHKIKQYQLPIGILKKTESPRKKWVIEIE